MKKYILLLFLIGLISFSNAQSCLPEGISFVLQQDINDFQTNYPGCTEIEGSVELHGSMWDISDLIVLTRINGNLRIIDCDELESLDGFDSLKSVGGKLEIFECAVLNNLTGLENLTSIGNSFEVRQNYFLMSLYGMNSLTSVGADMEIIYNESIKSLGEFSALTAIGGNLNIENNSDLIDLTGLSNLNQINGTLTVINNDKLASLDGIENIEHNSIDAIQIFWNNILSECEVKSVCDFIANESGILTAYSNSPGCNNPDEIEEACTSGISETNTFSNFASHPNPFNTSTTIEYHLNHSSEVTISIFNHLGEQILLIQQPRQSGKQYFKWNANGLPAGVYYFRLEAEEQMSIGKMVLMK